MQLVASLRKHPQTLFYIKRNTMNASRPPVIFSQTPFIICISYHISYLFFQDLVKSHLMNAVRSEVEELKEKIIKLEETISQQQIELTKQHTDFRSEVGKLQNENEFLKNHVAPDVLVQLSNLPPQPINTTTTATTTTATTQQQPQ